ncbi:hypothetical protein RD792_016028 [Penstemon davidsonii]|uniref:mitogen-activated protein kinase kinase kinase n=1 Tax=Penstemon davidsonii TaxID=160366 RepID=A0ABR0CJ92_9LAMI|nr:hypothetical protein RD792_016028 [Penstemon davidsonii]
MINLKHKRHPRGPRLDRRNAVKNIDYDASSSALTSPSSSSSMRTSFRLEGNDGEFDQIIRYLGFSGPEDFSIPMAAWEARKNTSPSAHLKTPRFGDRSELDDFEAGVRVCDGEAEVRVEEEKIRLSLTNGGWGIKGFRSPKLVPSLYVKQQVADLDDFADKFGARIGNGIGEAKDGTQLNLDSCDVSADGVSENGVQSELDSDVGSGIKGVRPPKLAPPPAITRSVMVDNTSSTWDIFRSFGPQDDRDLNSPRDVITNSIDEAEEEEPDRSQEENEEERRIGLDSGSDSSNDDIDADSVGLVGENDHTVSPNGSFRCNFKSWQKGDFLGSGSFGTVYEGFTDDGLFFAVKEVSLLDNGNQGQQSIFQLEQEISLLSQFQHENIVRYLGTDKDDAKLYIFLELVTKGSLAKLYQRYQLRDSQVSVYTRQILSGLNYLHCRNVVHRDIKCANILVDVSGSVKLADFGLAKATKLNDIKSCKGTPFWMAPEVVNQRNHGYGRAADIWSLGCTVLEMLTGRIPYSHLEGHVLICKLRERELQDSKFGLMQALFRIGRGELPPLPNTLSRDAQDFILNCLQVNPDDRPSAAKLLEHPFVKKTHSTFPSPVSPHYNAMRL